MNFSSRLHGALIDSLDIRLQAMCGRFTVFDFGIVVFAALK